GTRRVRENKKNDPPAPSAGGSGGVALTGRAGRLEPRAQSDRGQTPDRAGNKAVISPCAAHETASVPIVKWRFCVEEILHIQKHLPIVEEVGSFERVLQMQVERVVGVHAVATTYGIAVLVNLDRIDRSARPVP